jgi:hypothetical protein
MFDGRPWKFIAETEWTRVYKDGDAILYDSKFLRDGLEVSAELVKGRWSSLSLEQKLDFAQAFSAKPKVTQEDERILDFLMEEREPYVWATIATLLRRHSDKERVLAFLLLRIGEERKGRASFFQAARLVGDHRAVPALRAAYDEYRTKRRLSAEPGAEFDYIGYISCCEALWKLDGSTEYKHAIEEHTKSDNYNIRAFAGLILGGEPRR